MNTHIDVNELISRLPKTEIHLHIEGMASVDTMWSLIKKHNLNLGIRNKQELEKRFQIQTLNEFIDLYINIVQECFRTPEDIGLVINDVGTYMKSNNIRYAEIFFSPTKLILNGIPYPVIAQQLSQGAAALKEEHLRVRFIMDISRSYGIENAKKNLLYHLKYPSSAIIGIGMGGSEQKGIVRDFRNIFDVAAKNGLHVVAHAGEDMESFAVWDTIRYLKVQRIGHGISAYKDQLLMDYLRDTGIPLEICPTSNLYTARFAKTLQDHPLRTLYNNNLHVTINSDDPTIFSTHLNQEYTNLLSTGYTIDEIVHMIRNGVYATFMPEEEKNQLWAEISNCITEFGYSETLRQFAAPTPA